MRELVIVLTMASIVTIVALASVSLGFGRLQSMNRNAGFAWMGDHYASRSNNTRFDCDLPSHINVTRHMGDSTHYGHEAMREQLNVTDHMQHMHEENLTTSSTANYHGGCHG